MSNNKNIIVTGGAGYIGSHACKLLKENGFTPITFDNLSTGWQDAVKFGPFEQGDLLNKADLMRVFEKYRPFAVMHFAGYSQVSESMRLPEIYWENNVVGSLNLLQTAVHFGCLKFIFSSTCATYGETDGQAVDENSIQNPKSPYGSSKLAIEHLLSDFKLAHNLEYVIFRYFNVAGADPSAVIGEFHRPETHLIPLILDVASSSRTKLTVYGTDHDTFDGTCIRDYVHVCDVADAHLAGLRWLMASNESCAFNLGSQNGLSVYEVIRAVEDVTGAPIALSLSNKRAGDCSFLVSTSILAQEKLGWYPFRSQLRKIVADSWRWYQTGGYKS